MSCTPVRLSFVNPAGTLAVYRNWIMNYTVSGGESEEESESLGTNILGQPIKLTSLSEEEKRFIKWSIEVIILPAQLIVFKAMIAANQTIWTFNTKAEPGDRTVGETYPIKLLSWNYVPEGHYWRLSLEITNDVSEPEAVCGFSMSLTSQSGIAFNIPCSRITEWNRVKSEWFSLERSVFGKQLLKTSIYRYPYQWTIGFIATFQETQNLRLVERSQEEEIIDRNIAPILGGSSVLEWLNFNDSVEPDNYTCVGMMSNLTVKPQKSGAYQINLSFTEVFS